jgi:hypothetical protein
MGGIGRAGFASRATMVTTSGFERGLRILIDGAP